MAGNNIELITTYSPKYWDTVYKQESVTSFLDANPKMVNFTGTKTVKIGKWQNGGLHNYYRNNLGDDRVGTAGSSNSFAGASDFGYQKSAARLTWEEFTLRCDRGAAFEIEYFDNEESGDELVGLGVTEISKNSIIPEVDAYCLSTLASYCTTTLGNRTTYDATQANAKPIAELNKAFVYFAEHEVPKQDTVAFVSPTFMNALRNSTEATKFLGQADFDNKDIKFEITKYQGVDLIETSPERLRTNITLLDTDYDGGYTWASGSSAINFLMVAKSVCMHVVKYNKVKIISGETNLAARGFDGYTIFARIYHDVFVADNKRYALYLSLAGDSAAATAPEAKVEVLVNANSKVTNITTYPGDKLYFTVIPAEESASEIAVGSTLSSVTVIKTGDTVAAGTKVYAIDSNKKVVAIGTAATK